MGVIWLGGAAIRARYKNATADQGVDANQLSTPTLLLREVLADQSDRGHRASVSGWSVIVECQDIGVRRENWGQSTISSWLELTSGS